MNLINLSFFAYWLFVRSLCLELNSFTTLLFRVKCCELIIDQLCRV